MVSAYQKLWCSVLLIGIKDALRPRLRSDASGSGCTSSLDQYRARQWVGSRDFALVCLCAGMDPDFMAERIRPLIDAPASERAAFLKRLFGDHHPERRGRLAKAREAYERRAA